MTRNLEVGPNPRRTLVKNPLYKLLVAVFLAVLSVGLHTSVAAAQSRYSQEATLGDGVGGLDHTRSSVNYSRVWAIRNVGEYQLVGGAFLNVRDRSSFATIAKPYLAAFDPNTGEYVPEFYAQPNGTVFDIQELSGERALLAGEFTSVNSVNGTHGVAILDTQTGKVDEALNVRLNEGAVVRSVATQGNFLYLAGGFTNIEVGGVSRTVNNIARIDLTTNRLDPNFLPDVAGQIFGIDTASNGRVFIGGFFDSVNGEEGTETLAALNPNGTTVAGWNHGFPFAEERFCHPAFDGNCGNVNDLLVHGDQLFTAGAKHFWTAHRTSDGSKLAARLLSNDGQSVELVNGQIVVGCHCTHQNSDEFFGITDRYLRVIDPVSLTEVESPTVNSVGGAGGWAAADDPNGCVWGGGDFTSTTVNGTAQPAWHLLRFCPDGFTPPASTRPVATSNDVTPPARPTNLTITQRGSTVDLSWSSNEDQVGYAILRDGVIVDRTSGNTYSDFGVSPGIHEWQVAAFDMAGNVSLSSNRSAPLEIAQPTNIALAASATQSSLLHDRANPERALDGNTDPLHASLTAARTSGPGWIQLDLGSNVFVDRILLHPTELSAQLNGNLRGLYSTRLIETDSTNGHANQWFGRNSTNIDPRIEEITVAEATRYIRFTRGASLSVAELQVFTTVPRPTPTAPAEDVIPPTAPAWKAIRAESTGSTLRWGPAGDNRGVVYFEVYQDGELLGRTIERSLLVPGTGHTTSQFEIIAYDAAGLSSDQPPVQEEAEIAVCNAARDGQDVNVTWAATGDIDAFVIRRSVADSIAFWRGRTDGNTSSFTDSDRDGDITYSLEARSANNTTIDTADCTTTSQNNPDPIEPDYLEACEYTRNGIGVTVSWTGDTNPNRYVVRRSVDGSQNHWRGAPAGDQRTFADSDRADADITYLVEAKAANGSILDTVTCSDGGDVTGPTGLRVTRVERKLAVINWQTDGLEVEALVNGQPVATDDDGWITIRDLEASTNYDIAIRYLNSTKATAPIRITTLP